VSHPLNLILLLVASKRNNEVAALKEVVSESKSMEAQAHQQRQTLEADLAGLESQKAQLLARMSN
jgi:hypothetical protein